MTLNNSRFSKIIISYVLGLAISAPIWAGGSSSSKPLEDSNPIVLSHGILGFDDSQGLVNGLIKYWGGMDDYLRSEGADVLTTGKTAVGAVQNRSAQEKEQILMWMAANGHNKVNLLAHSQGALDTRYMVSNLNMSGKVAVLTTLNGVNHGTPIADISTSIIPGWMAGFVDVVVDFLGQLIYGDGDQDLMGALADMTLDSVEALNAQSPNASGTRYYSYGSHMTWADPIQHPIMFLVHPVTWAGGLIYGQGGSNDGVVPESSMKWGSWKGGPDYGFFVSGVDHTQAINFLNQGEVWFDVEKYYLKMAKNAMNNQ